MSNMNEVKLENIDDTLIEATLASIQTQSLTPIIKEELRLKIQSSRLAAGKEELPKSVFKEPEKFELTEEEVVKRDHRRELNRKAASKSRNKRKAQTIQADKVLLQLQDQNISLKKQASDLESNIAIVTRALREYNIIPHLGHQCSIREIHSVPSPSPPPPSPSPLPESPAQPPEFQDIVYQIISPPPPPLTPTPTEEFRYTMTSPTPLSALSPTPMEDPRYQMSSPPPPAESPVTPDSFGFPQPASLDHLTLPSTSSGIYTPESTGINRRYSAETWKPPPPYRSPRRWSSDLPFTSYQNKSSNQYPQRQHENVSYIQQLFESNEQCGTTNATVEMEDTSMETLQPNALFQRYTVDQLYEPPQQYPQPQPQDDQFDFLLDNDFMKDCDELKNLHDFIVPLSDDATVPGGETENSKPTSPSSPSFY